MSDRPLCLECFDNGSINKELAISKDPLMHTFTVFLALFFLNRVDCDALHLRSELVIDFESVLLGYGLFYGSFCFGHLALFLVTCIAKVTFSLARSRLRSHCWLLLLWLVCLFCLSFGLFFFRSGRGDGEQDFLIETCKRDQLDVQLLI